MNCFVSDFMQQQDANIAAMSSIRGQTVVCHLIQMNYMIRQSYGKKNAYKYIFYMTNEHHQVLKWMFIKNKDKFAEFEEVFKDLDKRYHANHEQIELVVTTLCCEWKDMIRHCLQNSPNVKIQYSVFEFVQNICKHLPKEHPRYAEICQDINQVVQPIGEYNHGIQPSGQSMISKWNNFTLKYQGEAYQGKPICDFITTEEINIIEHHGQNGYLTEFSPGYEVLDLLNEKLKKIFQKKISLSLAYTLIFMTLHKWNSDKGVKAIQSYSEYCMLQTLSDTIGHRQSGLPLVDEKFGLIPENVEVEAKQKLKKDASEFTVDDIEKIMKEIDSLLDRELHNDASLGENVNTLRDHSDYESMCSQRQYFTILSKMVKLWKTLTMVNKHAQDSLMCYHMCLSCEQSLNLTSIELADNEREIHDKRLERVAENWNMQVVPVQGDGNCLFTAVSMAVQGLQENGDMTHHLASLGLASNMEIPHMALRLRQLVVEEWTGQHGQQYVSFFPNINFVVEAERFLSSGTFGGELGNAMVLALSNVLQIPFVILSSVENWPVITVTPRSSVPSPNTLYLAFNQYGPGHYDCLVERSDVAEMTKAVEIKCNCGINNRKGEQEGNCCNSELGRRRRSRCPCLSRRVPCSRKCRCRNCGNLKPAPENSEGKRTRKRVKLSGEHILSNSKKLSKDLVAPKLQTQRQVGETSCVLDFCLLEAIHQSLQAEDLDCTAEALCNRYNAIFQWVQTLTVFIPLAEITLKKVNEILGTQQSKPSIYTLSLNG
ncbi:uncharacterized protein [Ptychodera flava]|uniref:uncharacterized protein n=1 Tax=Ptychodera flava TaxID=63121 RepID=UPI00396AA4B6